MRRVTLMLAAMAVMVSLFAVAAYAAQIEGSENNDFLTESQRGDTITALAGDDEVYAGIYSALETPRGNGDRDRVHGNKGNDYIDVADDTVRTLPGLVRAEKTNALVIRLPSAMEATSSSAASTSMVTRNKVV